MTEPYYEDGGLTLIHGKCETVLLDFPDNYFDSVVCDPPYELTTGKKGGTGIASLNPNSPAGRSRIGTGFMGKAWDGSGIAFSTEMWAEVFRVLKPGGHLLAFGGTRTYHRMAIAVEDAGFEIRDSIAWLYGSGFPKSMDVSKAIDKAARGVPQGGADPTSANHGQYRTSKTEGKRWSGDSGQGYGAGGSRFLADGAASGSDTELAGCEGAGNVSDDAREWEGWGTALKPAFEPIVVGRKPFPGTVAANVLLHGTGAINIDATRTSTSDSLGGGAEKITTADQKGNDGWVRPWMSDPDRQAAHAERVRGNVTKAEDLGRWPTNVLLEESQAALLDAQTGILTSGANPTSRSSDKFRNAYGEFKGQTDIEPARGADRGGASRFFPTFHYEAKAPGTERPEVDGESHATVKPLELMRWLVRLVTKPGGLVLDHFAGSGTTGEAALLEGMEVVLIEMEAVHLPLIMQRIKKPLQQSLFGDDLE